jgi:hypothetical protein
MPDPDKTGKKQDGRRNARGQFRPGVCGNPQGRPRGKGKATIVKELLVRANCPTPLEFLLSVMNDERASKRMRMQAAIASAPYCHPRLSSADVSVQRNPVDIRKLTDAELQTLIEINRSIDERLAREGTGQ